MTPSPNRLSPIRRPRRVLDAIILVMVACMTADALAQATQPTQPADLFANATVEVVSKGDYRFVEGPAALPDGTIAFSDIPNNRIHRFDPATGETTLMFDGTGGANGLLAVAGLDDRLALIGCAGRARELRLFHDDRPARLRFDPASTLGQKVPFFNSTNDITGSLKHGFYFTDPAYGGKKPGSPDEEAVYFTTLVKEGQAVQFKGCTMVDDRFERPNGIALTADGKTLYVADNVGKKIYVYDVKQPGKVANRRLLIDLDEVRDADGDVIKHGGPDGMCVKPAGVETQGHLFIALFNAGILVVSEAGEQVGFIRTGHHTTNCVFGVDGHLYVTANKSLMRVTIKPADQNAASTQPEGGS